MSAETNTHFLCWPQAEVTVVIQHNGYRGSPLELKQGLINYFILVTFATGGIWVKHFNPISAICYLQMNPVSLKTVRQDQKGTANHVHGMESAWSS